MTLTEVRQALEQLDLRPSRGQGQNFLIDANILRIIVAAADIRADETILEIGPGLGGLTAELLPRARRVIAIERDRRLCEFLRNRFPGLELIEGDAVAVLRQPTIRPADGFKVVANLPYSISTPILEQLVEVDPKPRMMVLLLQREVSERLCASSHSRDYGALTIFTQLHYHVSIAHVVSPQCFYPAPRVESAVTVLNRRDPRVTLAPHAPLHALVRQGFSQRRKMVRKLLTAYGDIDAAFRTLAIPATARAEELSVEQWISLANLLAPGR